MPMLPINQKLFANVDEIGVQNAVVARIDVLRDDVGDNVPRFGLVELADLGVNKPVDGSFEFEQFPFMAAIAGGRLFKVDSAGTVTEITITSGSLSIGTPAYMADFGEVAYFCNDSHIIRWDLSTETAAAIADPDAPTDATHLGFFNQYLLAKVGNSQRFEWADTGTPDVWLGEFASAEVRPDLLQGLYTAFGEIFLPGTSTIEYWSDLGDDLNPFGRLPGTETERGIIAPASVVLADNTYFFLDNEKRVIRLEGRSPKVISNPIDTILQKYQTVTDARGFHVTGLGLTLYVITFPTEGVTWAYNYKLDEWAQISFWNDTAGSREAFLCQNAVFKEDWGKTVLGSRKNDGKLYYATYDVDTDAGEPIRGEIITGTITHGSTTKRKRSKLMLHIKRGTSGLEGAEHILMYFRENGKTAWGTAAKIDLGIAGDEYAFVPVNRLGRYRSRQWRFVFPSVSTVLASAEETIQA